MAKLLIEANANIAVSQHSSSPLGSLFVAIESGSQSMVKLLLRYNAEVNYTAFSLSVKNGMDD